MWRPGAGDHDGLILLDARQRDRFGVLSRRVGGVPIEIGHLLIRPEAAGRTSLRMMLGHAVIRLPRRLPHMVVDGGQLSSIAGLRVMPAAWDRAQRVDIGAGPRIRVQVAEGGERVARAFFSPDVVHALQALGRSHDVEIRGDRIHLLSRRSCAAGSERRWGEQRALLADLARSAAVSPVWGLLRPEGERRSFPEELRLDRGRALSLFFVGVLIAVVVISALVIGGPRLLAP